jgi:hypothetical protein
VWWFRPGIFSYYNFQRIQNGMTLEQVEVLLSGPGEEISEVYIPRFVDDSSPVGSPERLKRVVAGDRFLR